MVDKSYVQLKQLHLGFRGFNVRIVQNEMKMDTK
jgi:hypothetical protein